MEPKTIIVDEAAQVIHSFKRRVTLHLNVEGMNYQFDDALVFDLSDLEETMKILLVVGLTQKNIGLSYKESEQDVAIYKQPLPGSIGVDQ